MDILKKLSPSEIKLILDSNKTKVTDLVRLTFIDLLLKQVLKVEIIEETVHTSKQVSEGSKFDSYIPSKHEELFIDAFKQSPDLVLTMYETMRLVKSEITSSKNFKWTYFIEPRIEEYFKKRPSIRLLESFTGFRLNDIGKKLQKELKSFFDVYSNKVKDKSLTIDETKNLYNSIGSNFILIDGLDTSFVKEVFGAAEKEERKRKRNQTDYTPIHDSTVIENDSEKEERSFDIPAIPILGGILVFEMLEQIETIAESISDSFSSSFDSFDSSNWTGGDSDGGWFSGDSGGWGDSGGDSGCSGCGGCGGD